MTFPPVMLRYINWLDRYGGSIMPARMNDTVGLRPWQIVVPAATSFTGSAIRIWRAFSLTLEGDEPIVRWLAPVIEVLCMTAALVVIPIVWVGVACWYVVWIAVYGPLFFLSRLMRRRIKYAQIKAAQHATTNQRR